MAKEKRAAIIGAGLGGLSAAIYLANVGYSVDVFEKNSFPGGKAGVLASSGFRFDTGPSLLTLPAVLQDIFIKSEENISDYLHIEPLNIICRYFYKDKTIINAYKDAEEFSSEISLKTSESPDSLHKYLNYCKTIYDLTADLFLYSDFHDVSKFMNIKALKTLLNLKKIDPFRTMNAAIQSFFSDQKIIKLFSRYATYNGSNPYEAPATLNIIPHVEYNIGGYIVKEGMFAVPKALEALAEKKGVKFYYNTDIREIEIDASEVSGIKAGNEHLKYKRVISNADVKYTYKYLLNSKNHRGANQEPSSSAIIFYWGLEGKHPELETHNVFFSEDYQKEFKEIFQKRVIPDDPTIYIYVSSKFRPEDAPEGKENWFVMINTPYHTGQNWDNQIDEIRVKIISKINNYIGTDLTNKINFEKYTTPADIERSTNSSGGSIYGVSSNTRAAAFLRQRNRSKEIKGLYFAGGSAHPGGGVPLVLLSGKLAAESVIKDMK